MLNFTTDQWIILALVFVLGALIGMWMTAGGRRKWKTRYNEELDQRRTLEKDLKDREAHWTTREKEWREQDSLRSAAVRDRDAGRTDHDRDGVPDNRDHRPADDGRF